jgi:hypothetical protein
MINNAFHFPFTYFPGCIPISVRIKRIESCWQIQSPKLSYTIQIAIHSQQRFNLVTYR